MLTLTRISMATLTTLGMLAGGCSVKVGDLGALPEATGATGSEGGPSDDEADTGSGSGGTDTEQPPTTMSNDVDILWVIDNSGSMAEEQAVLPGSAKVLFDKLASQGIDYRIGITTTDYDNPVCSGASSEMGTLTLSSCTERLEDFVFEGTEVIDAKTTCTDQCSLDTLSTTDGNPWIERRSGQSNLPPGVSIEQAFQCAAPVGINGCGFESQLESMYRAIELHAHGGFIRDRGVLAIIIVTDEEDCSDVPQFDSIFLREGMRTFWSDPSSNQATSAVCWNAGVQCTGESPYAECHAVNKDISGQIGVPDDEAVLWPVDRYVNRLNELRELGKPIVVAAITGVPPGYASGKAEITYADTRDEQFQSSFGIGPGCVSSLGEAVPPVRIRELAEAFPPVDPTRRNLGSICSDGYRDLLEATADEIIARIRE